MRTLKQKFIEERLKNYIWNKLFISAKEKRFLSHILKYSDILIFGGVIREFVLNNFQKVEHRDIDLVITNLNDEVKNYLNNYLVRINSFGGYKLKVNNKDIDLWKLGETWGIKNKAPLFNDVTDFLPETSFFNINAVAFSLKNNNLLYSEKFKKFLSDRELDIEFKPNPMPGLCFIKTYEYKLKYKVSISDKLIKFLTSTIDEKNINSLDEIQKKHFGFQKFSIKELNQFRNELINKDNHNVGNKDILAFK